MTHAWYHPAWIETIEDTISSGKDSVNNFLTKEEHEYYLNICKETYEGTHGKQHSHFSWNGEDNLNKINGVCNYQPKFLELASNPI